MSLQKFKRPSLLGKIEAKVSVKAVKAAIKVEKKVKTSKKK